MWVVICVCMVLFILLYAVVSQRVEVKRQSKGTFIALQAQWMAHAAIQHALLKFRILPTESYDASALARGVCPFYVASGSVSQGAANGAPLEAFRLDISSGMFPVDGVPGWSYEVTELKALNSFNRGDKRVHVVQIKGRGTAIGNLAGQEIEYTDELVKTVDVERSLAM